VHWLFAPFFLIFGIFWLGAFVLWIWALVDCIQVPDDSLYQSGTKLIWVLVIVFLNVIGAILYLAIGRPNAGARPGGTSRSTPPPPPAPPLDP
jgi:Phospholipase_D-nuclease N-terminal